MLLLFIPPLGDKLHNLYTSKNLQIPLFSGLLTVGAFLLSMKTFIIFKLKEDLYDNPKYITNVQETKLSLENYDHYDGLKQLSDYLSISILGSLAGAVLNLSIGFVEAKWSSILSISVSICTISLLFYAWYLVWSNLKDWLNILENPK